ncbi:carbonic anhydrase [Cyanobium sp. ATX 6F1]|nr:carbonic anhydrase [Cyanobium sp. ATX 6F1]
MESPAGQSAAGQWATGQSPIDQPSLEPQTGENPFSPDQVLDGLRAGHQRFLDGHSLHPHSDRRRMLELEEAQHPMAAVLGCADSRVPVELLFDTGFGDLFVVRNAGTMSFTAAIASLEFAVGHLGVPVIVVLGHDRCGAVQAALNPKLTLTPNLAQVVGQLRMELNSLGVSDDLEQACRHHTLNSARNLVDSSVLLTDRMREGKLQVEAAYYNLHTTSIDWMGTVMPVRFTTI